MIPRPKKRWPSWRMWLQPVVDKLGLFFSKSSICCGCLMSTSMMCEMIQTLPEIGGVHQHILTLEGAVSNWLWKRLWERAQGGRDLTCRSCGRPKSIAESEKLQSGGLSSFTRFNWIPKVLNILEYWWIVLNKFNYQLAKQEANNNMSWVDRLRSKWPCFLQAQTWYFRAHDALPFSTWRRDVAGRGGNQLGEDVGMVRDNMGTQP